MHPTGDFDGCRHLPLQHSSSHRLSRHFLPPSNRFCPPSENASKLFSPPGSAGLDDRASPSGPGTRRREPARHARWATARRRTRTNHRRTFSHCPDYRHRDRGVDRSPRRRRHRRPDPALRGTFLLATPHRSGAAQSSAWRASWKPSATPPSAMPNWTASLASTIARHCSPRSFARPTACSA